MGVVRRPGFTEQLSSHCAEDRSWRSRRGDHDESANASRHPVRAQAALSEHGAEPANLPSTAERSNSPITYTTLKALPPTTEMIERLVERKCACGPDFSL